MSSAVVASATVQPACSAGRAHTALSLVAAGAGVFPVPCSARTTSPSGVAFVPLTGWTSQTHLVTRTDAVPAARRVAAAVRRAARGGQAPHLRRTA